MTAHRAINFALVMLVVYLMAYFGPHLDESACLIGACGFIDLSETAEAFRLRDVIALWAVLILMALCSIVVICGALGYLAVRLGWI